MMTVRCLPAPLRVVFFLLTAACCCHCKPAPEPIRAVIITGQNNHNWPVSSEALRLTLAQSGLFDVDMAVSPAAGEPMDSFRVDFSRYEVVVLDYNGDPWSPEMQQAFLDYVHAGGGVVVYHAADNAFPDWPEYNQIIALGGWEGRDERSGPYQYWVEGAASIGVAAEGETNGQAAAEGGKAPSGEPVRGVLVRDPSPGRGGSHGTRHPYVLTCRRGADHPILKGLPSNWMHAEDELYDRMRGPGEIGDLLLTAWADPAQRGSGREEPLVFTVNYGNARIFHTMLGHVGETLENNPAMQCTGFQVLLLRAAEWCARGTVTQRVPKDFPTADQVSLRLQYQ